MKGPYERMLSARKARRGKLRSKLCGWKLLDLQTRQNNPQERNRRMLKDCAAFAKEIVRHCNTICSLSVLYKRRLERLQLDTGPEWQRVLGDLERILPSHGHVVTNDLAAEVASVETQLKQLEKFTQHMAALLEESQADRLRLHLFLEGVLAERMETQWGWRRAARTLFAQQECMRWDGAAERVQAAWRGYKWRKTVLHNPHTPTGQCWLAAQAARACAGGL